MTDKATIKKDFLNTIAATIYEFNMLDPKDSVLVAVSAGPDSVAMVLALLSHREKYAITMGIAHLNHMLRGEESIKDEAFVKGLAHKLGLPFYDEQKNVTAYAKQHGLSIEEAGREVRYHFFKQVAKTHGYKKIATGHNRDDNAELVLMNLLRGTGPKGLSGIPPRRNGKFIRPLIRVSKLEILDFLKVEKQAYVFDSSNKDMAYLRNRIRNKLIPHLQSEYNPEIIDALDRLSHILKQEENYLDLETEIQFNRCLITTEESSIALSKTILSSLHPAILNRVLRKAIKTIKKDLKRISFAHLNDIVEFCFTRSSGISLDLPGQIRIYKNKNAILVKKENKSLREIGKKQKQLRQMAKKRQDKER